MRQRSWLGLALLITFMLAGCQGRKHEIAADELQTLVDNWRELSGVRGVIVGLQSSDEQIFVVSGQAATDEGFRDITPDDQFDTLQHHQNGYRR